MTSPAARALRDEERLWADPPTDRHRLVAPLRIGFGLELLGITTVMVLMIVLPRL